MSSIFMVRLDNLQTSNYKQSYYHTDQTEDQFENQDYDRRTHNQWWKNYLQKNPI